MGGWREKGQEDAREGLTRLPRQDMIWKPTSGMAVVSEDALPSRSQKSTALEKYVSADAGSRASVGQSKVTRIKHGFTRHGSRSDGRGAIM